MSKMVEIRFTICPECGVKFAYEVNPKGGANRKYCSDACTRKANRRKEREYDATRRKETAAIKKNATGKNNVKSWESVVHDMVVRGFDCDYGRYQTAGAMGELQ